MCLQEAVADNGAANPGNYSTTMKSPAENIPVPPGWDRRACELWLAKRAREAVAQVLACVQRVNHGNPALALQGAYYLFLMGDHRSGASILEQQLNATPAQITSKGARSIALSANHSGIEFSRYIAASIGLGRPILPIHCVKIASMSGLV